MVNHPFRQLPDMTRIESTASTYLRSIRMVYCATCEQNADQGEDSAKSEDPYDAILIALMLL